MTDVHSPKTRSFNMSRIKGKNTKPEILVRSMIHRMGFRFRVHRKDLPGKPDLVFPKFKKVIFVHGCFWHIHHCKYGKVKPKKNSEFWQNKRSDNKQRDKKNINQLKKSGWKVLVIWECEIKNAEKLKDKINTFLVTNSG